MRFLNSIQLGRVFNTIPSAATTPNPSPAPSELSIDDDGASSSHSRDDRNQNLNREDDDDDASSTGSESDSDMGSSTVVVPSNEDEEEGSDEGEEVHSTPGSAPNLNPTTPNQSPVDAEPSPPGERPAIQINNQSPVRAEPTPQEGEPATQTDHDQIRATPTTNPGEASGLAPRQTSNPDFCLYGKFTEPNAQPASERDLKSIRQFLASKGVIGAHTTITKRGASVMITQANQDQAKAALAIRSFDGQPFRFEQRRPHFWEVTRGTVRLYGDNADISPAELVESLAPYGVTTAWRQKSEFPIFVVTFPGNFLPKRVLIGQTNHRVQMWHPLPQRCANCQRYGHYFQNCNAKMRCPRCLSLKKHDPNQCQERARCTSCGTGHESSDPECPRWRQEKEVLRRACQLRVHPSEARASMEQERPPPAPRNQWRRRNAQVVPGLSYAATASVRSTEPVVDQPEVPHNPPAHQPQGQHRTQPLPSAAWSAVNNTLAPFAVEGSDDMPNQVMWLLAATNQLIKAFGFEIKVTPIAPARSSPPQPSPTPAAEEPGSGLRESRSAPPPPTPAANESVSGSQETRPSTPNSTQSTPNTQFEASGQLPSMPVIVVPEPEEGWNRVGEAKKAKKIKKSQLPRPSPAGDGRGTSPVSRPGPSWDGVRTRAVAARSTVAARKGKEISASLRGKEKQNRKKTS